MTIIIIIALLIVGMWLLFKVLKKPRISSGQFVFDGVNGLMFPADTPPLKNTKKLLEVIK